MISNLAYVHPDARLVENVTVEPFAYIAENVEIGEGTWVAPHSTILFGARIGKNCRIFPSAVISGIPQDLKFRGEETTAEIGEGTTVREGATINRGTASAGRTIIGSNCLIMAYVHIGHDSIIGNNCILGNGVGLAGEVKIDDWAILSAGTLVHQFSRIGGHVMIGGGSKVRTDVPPFIKADRDPLTYLGLNTVGLTRRGFERERIDYIHNIYRVIYQNEMNISQALDFIEREINPTPDREYILDFIRRSERGIIRGPR
ncbi:MAG: acyl-ACP--UDP-N-acetylglucosamine O-acyltransferase [Bacteroidia bacterium]|nr:MAG: acyl-ACP--UDP-N-acetylglucosamine O-acyltransferase [Bacteroidia bacterium]